MTKKRTVQSVLDQYQPGNGDCAPLEQLTVAELRAVLKERGVPPEGRKAELVAQLALSIGTVIPAEALTAEPSAGRASAGDKPAAPVTRASPATAKKRKALAASVSTLSLDAGEAAEASHDSQALNPSPKLSRTRPPNISPAKQPKVIPAKKRKVSPSKLSEVSLNKSLEGSPAKPSEVSSATPLEIHHTKSPEAIRKNAADQRPESGVMSFEQIMEQKRKRQDMEYAACLEGGVAVVATRGTKAMQTATAVSSVLDAMEGHAVETASQEPIMTTPTGNTNSVRPKLGAFSKGFAQALGRVKAAPPAPVPVERYARQGHAVRLACHECPFAGGVQP